MSEQHEFEIQLATSFSMMFREGIRAVAATDSRSRTSNVVRAFVTSLNTLKSAKHSFSYYPVFEQALESFRDPPGLGPLDEAKLVLARAAMRLLATKTDSSPRLAGYNSRLARDYRNFDAKLCDLMTELGHISGF